MHYKFVLSSEAEDSYDIVLNFNRGDTEFGSDFFSKENLKGLSGKIESLIKNEGKGLQIRGVRIMLAGVLVASMTLPAFLSVSAADKYNMSYLYFGTTEQQMSYVDRTKGSLDMVAPSYFDINTDGTLKINTVSKAFVDQMHAKNMKVVPFVSNHWDQAAGKNALKNGEQLAAQIADAVKKYNLDGVNVDIENVTAAERDQYTAFVAALRSKIPASKEVSVAVAANPNGFNTGWHGSYDYAALAKNSDYLMIMAYDESWQGSSSGPVASIGFVEKSIQYALTKTTKDKIVVGVSFYGRIWSANGEFNGNGVSTSLAESIISKYNAKVVFDTAAQSPKATFTVKAGDPTTVVNGKNLTPGTYSLWYENEKSLQAKLEIIAKYDLKGAGSWALGQENPVIWDNYSSWIGNSIFADVRSTDWFAPAVAFAKDKGIESNKAGFKPNQVATRAECVAWLMKAYGIEPETGLTTSFTDVHHDSEYAAYIATAQKLGITAGVGNNKFAPDRELSREEMFTLIYNMMTELGYTMQATGNLKLNNFADKQDVSSWAEDELDELIRGGIVSGVGGNKLLPKQKATRAQVASVIYQLLKP